MAAGCTVVQTHTLASARLLLLLLPLVGSEWGDVKGRDAALELYFVTITRREGVASIPPLFFWSLSGTALIEFAPNWPPLPNTPPPPPIPVRREPVKRRTSECGLIEAIKTQLLKDKQSSFSFEWAAIFSNGVERRRLHSCFVKCCRAGFCGERRRRTSS